MKKSEIVLIVIATIGILMKLLNLPFSSLLISFSFLLLGCIYFYLGFAFFNNIRLRNILKSESYRGIGVKKIVLAIIFGWGLSILVIGIMFGVLNYPMKKMLLMGGLIFTVLATVTALLLSKNKEKELGRRFLKRGIAFSFLAVILLLLPEYSIETIQYRNHPTYLEDLKKYNEDTENEVLLYDYSNESQNYLRQGLAKRKIV